MRHAKYWWVAVALALILSASAAAQDDPLLRAFYERYYAPVQGDYSGSDLPAMWAEMKRYHADCAEITRERMKLAVAALLADRINAIVLSIPDNPWELRSALNLFAASSNVHALAADLGLADVPGSVDWLYRQAGHIGWIAAVKDFGDALDQLGDVWSFAKIRQVARGGLSPEQLKASVNIQLFALSIADELMDRMLVGDVRAVFKLDKVRVMLHSMCYEIADTLETLYRKAEQRSLTQLEALALMALEQDYLAKNAEIFSLEMEYWRRERDNWSPLDWFGAHGDTEHDQAMLDANGRKHDATVEHFNKRGRYIAAVVEALGMVQVSQAAGTEVEIAEEERNDQERDRLLVERGAMSRAEYERKWGGAEAGVRHDPGVEPGAFNSPRGIAIGNDGSIYVIDSGNHCVQRFSQSGEFVLAWGGRGEGEGLFENPNDVAVGPDGSVYVCDYWGKNVEQFTAAGRFVRSWSERGDGSGGLAGPTGISAAPDGTVYVLDGSNMTVYRYSAEGAFTGSFGGWDYFTSNPEGLEVGPDGSVYVCDSGAREVRKFSPDGRLLLSWGGNGNEPGQFNQPLGLAFGPDGSVFVIDCKPRLQQFTPDGSLLACWGEESKEPGGFGCSGGIAVDRDGVIYIADPFGDRVQKYHPDGTFLGFLGRPGPRE